MTMTIKDLSKNEELTAKPWPQPRAACGNFHSSAFPPGDLLMTPDGDPVQVYVDGVLVNSVTTATRRSSRRDG